MVEDMVATGEDIDAIAFEIAQRFAGYPEATGRVIDIDDDGIETMLGTKFGDEAFHRIAPATSDHIATKKDFHAAGSSIDAAENLSKNADAQLGQDAVEWGVVRIRRHLLHLLHAVGDTDEKGRGVSGIA